MTVSPTALGIKGVELSELGLQSWADRRWVDVPASAD